MSLRPSPDWPSRARVVHDFLRASVERDPNAVALIDGLRSVTYADLDAMVNRAANVLLAGGVGRGDRVVMAMDNGVEFVACYFGALRAGAVSVPLAAGPRSDRLKNALRDCAPKACILDRASAAREQADGGLDGVPLVLIAQGSADSALGRSLVSAMSTAPTTAPPEVAIDQDLAAIVYTSGSTGEPRGVMLTHRNIVANTRSIVTYLSLSRQDRGMCILPFYYVYGLSQLHTHMAVSGSLVLDNRFVYPNIVLQTMRDLHVTGFAGVPSTFALLLERSALREMTFPDLRYVTQAGGNMPPSRIRQWLDDGPQVPFFVMYGATEASARLTYLDPRDLVRKLGSIGKPIPDVEIQIVDEVGLEAGPGEPGELVARGANISCGYWNDPEASRQRFSELGYLTGDIGYKDDEGFLFLIGRRHDMIKVGAHRVGSSEIENVLHQHAAVSEAAVVAVPHDVLGEAPLAFVSLRPGALVGRDAILAFCRARMAPHKVPVTVLFRGELPKNGAGKIDKTLLRESALQSPVRTER